MARVIYLGALGTLYLLLPTLLPKLYCTAPEPRRVYPCSLVRYRGSVGTELV